MAARRRGSWQPAWVKWLDERSGKAVAAPGAAGGPGHEPIADAPGCYVLERWDDRDRG